MAASCKSCGAEIRWVETRAGRRMPIDVDENSEGTVVLEGDGRAAVLPKASTYFGPRYMPHHATCPQGKEWKRS